MNEQIQNELIVLKSRLFDTQEQLSHVSKTADSYAKTLQEIVSVLRMEVSDNVELTDIVAAVAKLVPVVEPEEVAPEAE